MNGLDRTAPPPVSAGAGARLPEVAAWNDDERWSTLECVAREVPLFHVSAVFDRGLLEEPEARAGQWGIGVAALTEGTTAHPDSSLMRRVEELGGEVSAAIGWESTAVQASGHLDQCDDLLALLGEAIHDSQFTAETVERLRRDRLATLKRLGHHAGALADAALMARLLPGRAGMPGTGRPEVLAEVDDAVAREGWQRIRAASRVGVIWTSGETLADRRRATILESLGWRPGGDVVATASPPEAQQPAPRPAAIVLVDRPQASQVELRFGLLAPARAAEGRSARRLLNAVLGGQFTSRLNLRLRERDASTYGVSSAFIERRTHGLFRIAAAVETAKIALAVRGAFEEIERLRAEPPTEAELEDARSYLIGVQPFRLQTLHGVGGQLRTQWLHELPGNALALETADLARPGAGDVRDQAAATLAPEHFQVVAVGPGEALRQSLAPVAREMSCELAEVSAEEVFDGAS